ncbi:MAG: hypothetical protein ACOYNO_15645, partial [Saprospiraceae bacterium]
AQSNPYRSTPEYYGLRPCVFSFVETGKKITQRDEKDSTSALFMCIFLQTVNETLSPVARHHTRQTL